MVRPPAAGGCRARASGFRLALLGAAMAGTLAAAGPAGAVPDLVDALLARLFGVGESAPYVLTADFSGYLFVSLGGTRLRADATGTFQEWRGSDHVRRRSVRLQTLRLPLLLRPFAGTLRRTLEEQVEAQADTPETFLQHDVFLLTALPAGRFILAGVQRSIVTDAVERFGWPEDRANTLTRREIARWLYTSPAMRGTLVRAGPPYAFRAVVDDAGLLHELILYYDWGAISTRVEFVTVSNQPVARQIVADTATELSGVGRVAGQMILTLFNHCVNCARP